MGRKCLEEQDSAVLLLSLESGQMKKRSNEVHFDIYELWNGNKVPSSKEKKKTGVYCHIWGTNKRIACKKLPRTCRAGVWIHDTSSQLSQTKLLNKYPRNTSIITIIKMDSNTFLFHILTADKKKKMLVSKCLKISTCLFLIDCTFCPVINRWCDRTSWLGCKLPGEACHALLLFFILQWK